MEIDAAAPTDLGHSLAVVPGNRRRSDPAFRVRIQLLSPIFRLFICRRRRFIPRQKTNRSNRQRDPGDKAVTPGHASLQTLKFRLPIRRSFNFKSKTNNDNVRTLILSVSFRF